jgi:predicted N-acetyltransferase YhbS
MFEKRTIVIKTNKEAEVSAEELYEIRREAFQQWKDIGLDAWEADIPINEFKQLLTRAETFVAQDEMTGELLAMRTLILHKKKGYALEGNFSVSPKAKRQGVGSKLFKVEQQRLRENGYRYVTCTTAIPATWSVQWHLKNGYYIVGYSRSERNNYASYVFRKQIATDVRHHPTDLLWTGPIAPITAKIRYCLTWMATMVCKDNSGKLNAIGRIAKKLKASIR